MNKRSFMSMVSLVFILAVYSSGQEKYSQAIIGEWIRVEPKDGGLVVITFTDRQMALRRILFGYGSEESLTGTGLPFEYEIYDTYLILNFDHRQGIFIIKSDTVIEELYTTLGDGIIFRKKY